MRADATTAGVQIPRQWYNVLADFPELDEPYIDASSGREISADALSDLFAPDLVHQELDRGTRLQAIPEEVMERYVKWRPTPLVRATALERALGTRCRIYYKYEGGSPIGSHKANSGVVQAFYSKRGGIKRIFAETGAGQWGSAISMGSGFFGLECQVFMVGNSFDSKPSRRILMESFGSTVVRSPTEQTEVGRRALAEDPNSDGSLGMAIAEALEATRADSTAAYALGSAFNFVCMHQTVIGQELKSQLDATGVKPDVLVSCIGGGSSFAGLVFPFLEDMRSGKRKLDLLATESNAVPKVTRGTLAYDYGDTAGLTPLIKMYTLGHQFMPPGIHSGGLRYHGLAPQVSKLISLGMARGQAYSQLEIFRAASLFTQAEGIVPAPEAAHSIAAVCELARKHKDEEKTMVFCLTGHGFFDLSAYDKFNRGEMDDSSVPDAAIDVALGHLPPTPREAMAAAGNGGGRQPAVARNGGGRGEDTFGRWQRRHFGDRPAAPAAPARSRGALAAAPAPASAPAPAGAAGQLDLRGHRVVSERLVGEACERGGGDLLIDRDAIVTPLAHSEAQRHGRRLILDRG
jgi:tryptophan synthase beta chain